MYTQIGFERMKIKEYSAKVDTTDVGKAYSTIVATHQSTLTSLTTQATLLIQANLSTMKSQ
jgi:hypothetical protein